jgi:hypothetical protein
MPFDLGDHPTRLRPASGLISEVCIGTPHFVRRTANGALEQVADPFLQDAVGRQTDRIFDPFGFQILVNFRVCEAGVGAEIDARELAAIARHDRLQNAVPSIGAMNIAGA